jgi:hypothetical protein
MGESTLSGSSGFRLAARRLPTNPIMLKTILESWCYLNCSGRWDADLRQEDHITVAVDFHEEGDLMLFMLSEEYGYMGSPPYERITTLTN